MYHISCKASLKAEEYRESCLKRGKVQKREFYNDLNLLVGEYQMQFVERNIILLFYHLELFK